MDFKSSYNLPESSFEVDFIYSDKDFKVEFLDHVEPYELSEKVSINRHGIVFKEFIYVL